MVQLNRYGIAAAAAAAMSLVSLHAATQYGGGEALNPNSKATLIEDLPSEERDSQHMVTHERG